MTKLIDSFETDGKKYNYYDLKSVGKSQLAKIPFSHKILLENALRNSITDNSNADDVDAILNWDPQSGAAKETSFNPSGIILQAFTGVPVAVELVAMRNAVCDLGGVPSNINSLSPGELVIDRYVKVEYFGTSGALKQNNHV